MQTRQGSIWDLGRFGLKVIPTNIGWKSSGHAVMGAGLALSARRKYPGLDEWYGALCQRMRERTTTCIWHDLILFPTKPLDPDKPHLSWMGKATLELLEVSLTNLAYLCQGLTGERQVFLPHVGCGNGGMNWDDVEPIVRKHLEQYNVVIVDPIGKK